MNIGFTRKDIIPLVQNDASATTPRPKPAVPKKPLLESDAARTNRVRDMVRRLQERNCQNLDVRPSFPKPPEKVPAKPSRPEKEEAQEQASNRTLEDLKAIDEDIEKLRNQIEERDKIIGALRKAAEAKDKKLEQLLQEFSKVQTRAKSDLDGSPEPNRSTSSSPSSPPLCTGGSCWTDSFVNENYREPVYARLFDDHAELRRAYRDLRSKLEVEGNDFEAAKPETETPDVPGTRENAINLIMAEQIRALKEREAQLVWEAEELREQNDLMEFRILELEECRKEFLDKETSEGKHRREGKIIWRERDLEEVSDSGVMSLPTSEDLTSDSELGDAIRNYSPLGGITNLNSPATENLEVGQADFKQKKSLKSSECLQESGVFVDSEPSADCAALVSEHSKASQTEPLLHKTLLDILDSSCGDFLSENSGCPGSDDLSAEISKLSVIRRRIQQKASPPATGGRHAAFGCPHSNSLAFYEERLVQLEDKLKIYESSGDAKDVLLAKRLQKEVDLARTVKELGDKVAALDFSNKRLEEEKCEFEEAENDARFQCQRLEIRLQELIDKNAELELEVERQKLRMAEERRREKRKGGLESLVSQYEQRNFELEEKEVEARERLSMMEAAMPAIVAWNVFRMLRSSELVNFLPAAVDGRIPADGKTSSADAAVFQRLEELLDDQKKLRRDYEKVEESAADREKVLRSKIAELEAKATKDRETLEEMTYSLKALKSEREEVSPGSARAEDVDLFEELKQMVANEVQLRVEIERLEKKEEAYMHSLEKADEIWAGMEADYKRRLHEAETANGDLQARVSQLEATRFELERTLEEHAMTKAETPNDVDFKIEKLLSENEKLKNEFAQSLNERFEERRKFLEAENSSLREELKKLKSDVANKEERSQNLEEELELAKEEIRRERVTVDNLRKEMAEKSRNVANVQDGLQCQISQLTQDLSQKGKELSSLEVTVAELREEVETLEKKVAQLVENMQAARLNQEESPSKTEVPRGLGDVVSFDQQPGTGRRANRQPGDEGEVAEKKGNNAAGFRVPTFPRPRFQSTVFPVSFLRRQELRFLFPRPESAKMILPKRPRLTLVVPPPEKARKESDPVKEEEFFRLSLKNTELQQTLERIEEEWRLKDKELEELTRIALEIQKEQNELELLYDARQHKKKPFDLEKSESVESNSRVCGYYGEPPRDDVPEKLRTSSQSVEILHAADPISVKTPEQVSSSLSSLQIALDNLQNKCRAKSLTLKPLVGEGRQTGDNGDFEDRLILDCSSDVEIERRGLHGLPAKDYNETERNSKNFEPKNFVAGPKSQLSTLGSSATSATSATSPLPPSFALLDKSVPFDPEFSFVAPIKTIRKVGDDGIFLEWDIARRPENVTGFEVKVNGALTHRVRSSTRNKAFLHPLNLGEMVFIQVSAISKNGRSLKCSFATYPQEHLPPARNSP